MNPHAITKELENALCNYTGSKYAVAVNSCTAALFLALKWCGVEGKTVEIPRRTYVSVPWQIIHAGGKLAWRDQDWQGGYRLGDTRVWDFARRFTSGMYEPRTFQCLSFHASKVLSDSQGGCIIHDDEEADAWFRRARLDGRTEGVAPADDTFTEGWHAYLSPDVSARLLWRMQTIPAHNADLPRSDYPDLSLQKAFK